MELPAWGPPRPSISARATARLRVHGTCAITVSVNWRTVATTERTGTVSPIERAMILIVVIGLVRQRAVQRIVLSVAHSKVVGLAVNRLATIAPLRESVVITRLNRVRRAIVVIGLYGGLCQRQTGQSDKSSNNTFHDVAPFGRCERLV